LSKAGGNTSTTPTVGGVRRGRSLASRYRDSGATSLGADGGWKYLSTNLWTTNYEDLPEDIEDKIWW
jgi:hypothetical protein